MIFKNMSLATSTAHAMNARIVRSVGETGTSPYRRTAEITSAYCSKLPSANHPY